MSNTMIAATSQPGIFGANGEIYAQAFAHQSYVTTLTRQTSLPLTETANGLFNKGIYGCAQSVGAQLAGKSLTLGGKLYTVPYACN